MSSLQSINGFNLDSDLVQNFLKDYTVLAKNGKNIILCWIPSHVGILGNEKADAALQLQNRHSPYLSLVWSFLPQACILV